MTQRERFRKFIKGSSKEQVIPFPIYKTAFVASALGREWATDVNHKECRDVLLDCGCIPSLCIGEKEWFPDGHYLSLSPKVHFEDGSAREYKSSVQTPFGEMNITLGEYKRQSLSLKKGPVEKEEDFKKVLWYIKEVRNNTDAIKNKIIELRNMVGEDCLITIFLPQPYELYCIFNREEAMYLEIDNPEIFGQIQYEILETVKSIIKPSIDAGADMLFFGSAGTELYSPSIFKDYLLKPSIEYANLIRQAGGISSFHLCGRAKEYVDMGAFDEINVDILEGLPLEPAGNIKSLKEVRKKIPESTIIRGNINLDLLHNATQDEVYREAAAQLKEVKGHRHILSGECDILFGTPVDNVRTLSHICEEVNV